LPAILGIDLAGVVKEVGEGVTRLSPGDEVYGMAGGVGGNQGSLAQYAAVDERLLAIKPSNISMREAAALPLIFIRGCTLVGVSLTNLDNEDAIQLMLPFDEVPPGALDAAVDGVKDRFGSAAVTRAVLLGRDPGLSVPLLPD